MATWKRVAILIYQGFCKHLKHASSYHHNNARGLLVNITSLPLNSKSPTNPDRPFYNYR
jgi:hypothetical protein